MLRRVSCIRRLIREAPVGHSHLDESRSGLGGAQICTASIHTVTARQTLASCPATPSAPSSAAPSHASSRLQIGGRPLLDAVPQKPGGGDGGHTPLIFTANTLTARRALACPEQWDAPANQTARRFQTLVHLSGRSKTHSFVKPCTYGVVLTIWRPRGCHPCMHHVPLTRLPRMAGAL